MKAEVHRKALIHGIATCMNCNWREENYLTVQVAAKRHARQSGHRVSVELGYHMEIAGKRK